MSKILEEYLKFLGTSEQVMAAAGLPGIDSISSGKPLRVAYPAKYGEIMDKHLHPKEVKHRKKNNKR